MKAVMISIKSKWAEKIMNGEKTIEVRKTAPKIDTPFKCFIYMTKNGKIADFGADRNKLGVAMFLRNSGKVIGEFICDRIYGIKPHDDGYGANSYTFVGHYGEDGSCLTFKQLDNYLKNKIGFGWHISNLKIYDKPKEIGEFRKCGKDDFCGNCKHIVVPPNREPLSDCDRYCDKYNVDLVYYDWFLRCYKCYDKECVLTRPPQSWFYVEI